MPVGLAEAPHVDIDSSDAAAPLLPVSQWDHTQEAFSSAIHLPALLHFAGRLGTNLLTGEDPDDPSGLTGDNQLDTHTLNDRYGVPGYLRFNDPTTAGDAAWRNNQALQRQQRDFVFSHSSPQPLTDFGAGLAGSLVDPTNWAIAGATGGIGEAVVGGLGFARGAEAAGSAISGLGRLATVGRTLTVGAIDNAPYVAANAALSNYAGDDYDMGDALRDITAGAVLHTTLHLGWRAAANAYRRFGAAADPDAPAGPGVTGEEKLDPAFTPNPAPAGGVPDAVDNLTDDGRRGAFVKAVDDLSQDRPVDVGQYVDRENNPDSLAKLNETSAEPTLESFRPVNDDHPLGGDQLAVTTRGSEIPVRYGLAELGELTTSHDDNLAVNPAYPAELQPRARERAGAQARNYQLEAELNPKLLMGDASAAGGAPIVASNGVVESGNGRTIALRRSAAKGGEAYARYRAELEAQGHDTTGMSSPVLVRMRTEALEGSQRAGLAREMNADVTERMSATEQATADAQAIDDATLAHLDGTPEGLRTFNRAFLARVAPDQVNSLIAPDGALSKAGQDRIDAALTAKAYGDPRLVEALFETSDGNIKAIGQALRDAAPAWASMRAAVARGEIAPALDVTENLRTAVDLVRAARDSGENTARFIADRLDQTEMFSSVAISPATEAFLRLLFRPAGEGADPAAHFSRPLAGAKVAQALKDYAAHAEAYRPGPDLFGVEPTIDVARQLLANLAARFARDDAGDLDLLRPPGRSDGAAPGAAGSGARAPLLDVRQPGEDGGGQRGGVSPDGEQGPGGQGGGDEPGSRNVVSHLAGDEVVPAGTPRESVRATVRKWIADNLRGKTFINAGSGAEIGFNNRGINKGLEDLSPKRLAIFAALPDILRDGEMSEPLAPKSGGDRNFLAVHDIHANVDVGGEIVPVRVVVRQMSDGKFYYSHFIGDDAAPRAKADTATPKDVYAGGSNAEHDADGNMVAATASVNAGDAAIAADPELKALAEDTQRLADAHGVEAPEAAPSQDPNTQADAVEAAASCLSDAADEVFE